MEKYLLNEFLEMKGNTCEVSVLIIEIEMWIELEE
jgi:hypothetical protein